MNATDTAFVMVCSALVLVMTPGLAIFYGGLTRSKNVLSTMMHSFFLMGLASVIWWIYGYSLAFGPDVGGVIGNLSHFMGAGVGAAVKEGTTIPHTVFLTFQGMFVIITPALISGAFAERMKFSAFVVFSVLWITFVYAPICHWVWGGGWLQKLGCVDFAGGLVVHLNCGVASLVAAVVVGKRKGYGTRPFIPHNLTLTLLGRGTVVVRMVRVQRGQPTGCGCSGGKCVPGDSHGRGHGRTYVDVRGMDSQAKAHDSGACFRGRGRTRFHHSRVGLCGHERGVDNRRCCGRPLLRGRPGKGSARLRRFSGRGRYPRSRRSVGNAVHRLVCLETHQS